MKAQKTPIAIALNTSEIITNVANVFVSVNKSKDTINELIKPLQLAKITMNTIKQNCALSLRFMSVLDDAKVSPTTARNYLAEIRSAVNNGTKFSFNAAQERARAKAKTEKASKPVDTAPSGIGDPLPLPNNPAGTTATAPKRLINMPSDCLDAIVVALSNVRAGTTQETWLQVMTLNPALSKFLDRATGIWQTLVPAGTAPVVEAPAPVVEAPAPAKRTRKAK